MYCLLNTCILNIFMPNYTKKNGDLYDWYSKYALNSQLLLWGCFQLLSRNQKVLITQHDESNSCTVKLSHDLFMCDLFEIQVYTVCGQRWSQSVLWSSLKLCYKNIFNKHTDIKLKINDSFCNNEILRKKWVASTIGPLSNN